MPLTSIAFDPQTASTELTSFKAWMEGRPFFPEREVVTEIKMRQQMACLFGYSILMPKPDLIQFEFAVRGLFRADLVVGNDASRKFILVEFEGGEASSAVGPRITVTGRDRSSTASDRLSIGAGQSTTTPTIPRC